MISKVFVTGAAGFVGANLIHRLINENYDVHIAVRNGGSLWRLSDVIKKIHIHEGILNQKTKLHQTLKKIQPVGIFHLAAYGSYPKQSDNELMISTNITGLLNLLEACREIKYHRFAIAGSSSEYGKKIHPMKESDYTEPNNMYAVTKVSATNLAVYFGKTFHKPVNILRLFSVYGYLEEEGRLVRSVIQQALNNQPIKLATGKEARDFIFVEDIATAFLHTLKVKRSLEGEIFNLGTGIETTVLKLAKRIIYLTGSKSKICLNTYVGRPWDTFHWKADINKTRRILGFTASTKLDDGLKKTIQWYKDRI
jgi:polyisoprenyl-phosphate glycosyltransferase